MNHIGENEIISNPSNYISGSESSSEISSNNDDEDYRIDELTKNKVIIDYINNPDSNINYLNENNKECLICYDKLKEKKVSIQNNYCRCFFFSLLCEKCFFCWFNRDAECFICRKTFSPDKNNRYKNIDFYNSFLLLKLRDNIEDNKSLKYNVPPPPPPYPPIIRLPSIRSSLRNTQNSNTEEISISTSNELRTNTNRVNSSNRNRSSVIETSIEIENENNNVRCTTAHIKIILNISLITFGCSMIYLAIIFCIDV